MVAIYAVTYFMRATHHCECIMSVVVLVVDTLLNQCDSSLLVRRMDVGWCIRRTVFICKICKKVYGKIYRNSSMMLIRISMGIVR